MILPYALAIFLACIVLSLVLNIWRLLTALTLDTMTVNAIALVVAYGIWAGTGLYLEIAVIFALTGFVGSVAYCKYLLRGSIIE
jgi:multicomponent K+:H+ antiporter subunit F